MNSCDILLKPIITEASMENMQEKKYTFKVLPSANKIEIAKAVEENFKGAKVEKVTTSTRHGKTKRRGKNVGKLPDSKIAIVKLTEDSKAIEFFEGLA